MRRYIYLLVTLLLPISVQAQVESIPQIFSPNAAELGKYGRVPVNYFNGLPEIRVPITDLRAKDYSLPVYLTYHAGGNRPDQHPGWVGLGWTLHAGGCINRIVHGHKDEMVWEEYSSTYLRGGGLNVVQFPFDPGYFYRMAQTQGTDWEIRNNLESIIGNTHHYDEDYYPDEFQICIDDIQASFYFVGENDIRIVSKSPADFTVECRINTDEDQIMVYPYGSLEMYNRGGTKYYAHLYHYIEELIVTNHDGTKYYFGGDKNAIEFSVVLRSSTEWDPVGTANTWMLKRIERPNGEVISFSYSRGGVPLVKSDCHRVENIHYHYSQNSNVIVDNAIVDTFKFSSNLDNVSFTFLMPLYLSRIESTIGGDILNFYSSPTSEMDYEYDYSEFCKRMIPYSEHDGVDPTALSYDFIRSQSYYRGLSLIVSQRGFNKRFNYVNTSTERLRLGSVQTLIGNELVGCYSMTYNATRLPKYNSKQVDAWGYYSGMTFGQSVADTVNIKYNKTLVDTVLMKAEILTKLTYPTGGHTSFEYEAHRYSKKVSQFPFELNESPGITSGLRIRKIKDVPYNGSDVTRTFIYENNGVSSGILSGTPKFRVSGTYENMYGQIDRYDIYREYPLNPLSTTNGNHVTYSYVKEQFADGSWTEYTYTNHDTAQCMDEAPSECVESTTNSFLRDAFITRELVRGLLTKKVDYGADGIMRREEALGYSFNFDEYIRSVNWTFMCSGLIYRLSPLRLFTFYPKLVSKTIKDYSDTGTYPQIETTMYDYNAHRQLVGTVRAVSGSVEEFRISYSSGMDSTGVYGQMREAHILNRPVERIVARDGKIVEATLTTYKAVSGNYLPENYYRAALGTDTFLSNFSYYNGQAINPLYHRELTVGQYDSHGNPLLSKDKSDVPTTYVWDSRGDKLNAIFVGSINGSHTYYVRGPVPHTETADYMDANPAVKTFNCEVGGTFNFAFTPNDTTLLLSAKLDGNIITIGRIGNGSQGTVSPVNITSGSHTLEVYCDSPGYHLRDGDHAEVSGTRIIPIETYPLSGRLSLTYPRWGAIPQDGTGMDCFFEDFETSGGTYGYGFQSNCGRTTPYQTAVLLVPNHPYVLDYMRMENGRWHYVRETVTPTNRPYTVAIEASPSNPIDHVRFYPVSGTATSYTWRATGDLRCRVEADGRIEIYEYDPLGRLISVSDGEGNALKQYTYHYIEENND